MTAPPSPTPQAGLCMYCGHVFHGNDPEDIARVYQEALDHDQVCDKNPLVRKLSESQEKLREAEKERDGYRDAWREESKRYHELRMELTDRRARDKGEVWYWQDDGEDHPESLACPAIVRPDVIRRMSAAEAALAAAVEREKTMAEALTAHNDNARSFFQIANRIATELGTHALGTNFGGFAETTHGMLTKYHQITNDARALAAPQEERGQ